MGAYYKGKTKEELERIIEQSKTFAEFMKILGYSGNRGNSVNGLKKYLDGLKIDYSKFSKTNIYNFSHPQKSLNELLVKYSDYTNFTRLKKRIMRENLLGDCCSICGIKDWNGKKLVLQIDHINGDNRDNRLENLRLLCPNCHSQTETFCRKKRDVKKKVYCTSCGAEISKNSKTGLCADCAMKKRRTCERPSKEELLKLLFEHSFTFVASIYNVSGNTIKKWCDYYEIPKYKKGYKNKKILK